MPKTGRKPHKPTNETRAMVIAMIAAGFGQVNVGAVIGISKPTLAKHYKRELANGYASITARIAARLIAKADAGDERAIEFYLERRGGWVRRNSTEGATVVKSLEVSFRWADATPNPRR
jgi:hypothetical protein